MFNGPPVNCVWLDRRAGSVSQSCAGCWLITSCHWQQQMNVVMDDGVIDEETVVPTGRHWSVHRESE